MSVPLQKANLLSKSAVARSSDAGVFGSAAFVPPPRLLRWYAELLPELSYPLVMRSRSMAAAPGARNSPSELLASATTW
jgi:hypothetical protein